MKHLALGDDILVNLRGRVVRQANLVTPVSAEDIAQEVEFQEIVEEDNEKQEQSNQVMSNGDHGRQLEKKRYGRGGSRIPHLHQLRFPQRVSTERTKPDGG